MICMSATRPVESTLSDDEDAGEEEAEERPTNFSFPELDAKIRKAVSDYGAVFPKLNFSSPRVRQTHTESCVEAENWKCRMPRGCYQHPLH